MSRYVHRSMISWEAKDSQDWTRNLLRLGFRASSTTDFPCHFRQKTPFLWTSVFLCLTWDLDILWACHLGQSVILSFWAADSALRLRVTWICPSCPAERVPDNPWSDVQWGQPSARGKKEDKERVQEWQLNKSGLATHRVLYVENTFHVKYTT